MERCAWPGEDPLYCAYHDEEWGVPEYDDRALFEKLMLDGFQAGLAWITILRKRDGMREAFDGFDPEIIARYGEADIERLLTDARIIRSRTKINAAIGNARAYLDIQASAKPFSERLWDFVDEKPVQNHFASMKEVPAQTPTSEKMAKELKRLGFKFCGPVIVYAFMQATGFVNDHMTSCFCHAKVKAMSSPE
ncbi:DNA-3-methyladenine glycosylase I [Woodsholea maritima]|uniref:DNA-3-methyladenine glycosylase I n=1 Tax=Woodsholea maritima TaxID=240237 RepID=UPI000378B65D|nr:DNA-3-methyladenine glycosylase I [Woodsholea maritima]